MHVSWKNFEVILKLLNFMWYKMLYLITKHLQEYSAIYSKLGSTYKTCFHSLALSSQA